CDQRYSMATVLPSIQPSAPRRATNAAVHGAKAAASAPKNPMVGSLPAGCARTASGQQAIAPPANDKNSRRRTCLAPWTTMELQQGLGISGMGSSGPPGNAGRADRNGLDEASTA